jgi:hypothetical protein
MQEPEAIMRGLAHLVHDRHLVSVFHVLDAAELSLGTRGLMEVQELESGARMLLDADQIHRDYEQAVERYLLEMRRGVFGVGAGYHLLETGVPIDRALAENALIW